MLIAIAQHGLIHGRKAGAHVESYLAQRQRIGLSIDTVDLEEAFTAVQEATIGDIAWNTFAEGKVKPAVAATFTFFMDRLKVQQREAGVRHDLIDAVFALGNEDDLVRLLARVHALQAFVGTEDGVNLLAGYKRAANILKKEGYDYQAPSSSEEGVGGGALPQAPSKEEGDHPPTPYSEKEGEHMVPLPYTPEPAEKALIDALDVAAPRATLAVAGEDFAGAMAALASLRGPIDAFFQEVTVNDADPDKRAARLALLARFRAAVHNVADFSKIEG